MGAGYKLQWSEFCVFLANFTYLRKRALYKVWIQENLGLGQLNSYEQELVGEACKQLTGEIAKGEEFVANFNLE